MPTARWTGVPLHEVLKRVGPSTYGVQVRFEGADHGGYHLTPVLPETGTDLTFVQPDVPPWNRLGDGNNAIEVPFVDVR